MKQILTIMLSLALIISAFIVPTYADTKEEESANVINMIIASESNINMLVTCDKTVNQVEAKLTINKKTHKTYFNNLDKLNGRIHYNFNKVKLSNGAKVKLEIRCYSEYHRLISKLSKSFTYSTKVTKLTSSVVLNTSNKDELLISQNQAADNSKDITGNIIKVQQDVTSYEGHRTLENVFKLTAQTSEDIDVTKPFTIKIAPYHEKDNVRIYGKTLSYEFLNLNSLLLQ